MTLLAQLFTMLDLKILLSVQEHGDPNQSNFTETKKNKTGTWSTVRLLVEVE